MFITKLKRVFKNGLINFYRNAFVSFSALIIMIITLFVIGGMVIVSAVFSYASLQIKDKVDISVYFVTTTAEEEILAMQKSLEALPEVQTITYVSRAQALESFRDGHKDNALLLSGLEQIGDNPFRAELKIKAKEPSQYAGIATYLTEADSAKGTGRQIDNVTYYENKDIIDRLDKLTSLSTKFGFWIMILFILTSVIITYNTIRLIIFTAKEEISVMRLVGASQRYIKGPFVVTGMTYGLIASLFVLVLFWPLTYWLGSVTSGFAGLDIFDFYVKRLPELTLILIGSGLILGMTSSFIAVQRYLKF